MRGANRGSTVRLLLAWLAGGSSVFRDDWSCCNMNQIRAPEGGVFYRFVNVYLI